MTRVISTTDFNNWINKLKDLRSKQRIIRRLDRLADGNPGDVRPVGGGVSELRMPFGPGYRVYYLHEGSTLILLLCGGDKSSQQQDIDQSQTLATKWRTEQGKRDSNDGE